MILLHWRITRSKQQISLVLFAKTIFQHLKILKLSTLFLLGIINFSPYFLRSVFSEPCFDLIQICLRRV